MLVFLLFVACAQLAVANRPNVLFIAVDDLRPELGCYGNTIVKSPNIDRLASRGIVFSHAYVQQAVCSPSRTSLMTGLRPDVTKVWDLETHFRVAKPECVTLPQYFKANGYHCAALSKIYHKGFEDGRSWSEPHWYPTGKSVDTDLVDYAKQIVTKHEVNVTEFAEELSDGPTPMNIDGISLKNLIEDPSLPANRVAISQYHRRDSASGTNVMGYSIRDRRWRATFWRERNGPKIIATELYDEQNDPEETVSVADKPEHKTLLESLVKHLPAVGSAAIEAKPSKSKKPAAIDSKTPADSDDRGARFDKLDKEGSGKLTREYYTTHQSDAVAAGARFEKWDSNKDGFLSRDEYVSQARKNAK